MNAHRNISASEIRERQGHPTIDADGHILEYRKIVLDYVDTLYGAKTREDFLAWDPRTEPVRWAHAGTDTLT